MNASQVLSSKCLPVSPAAAPQLSGGALRYEARRTCIVKWRTCDALATPYDRPLQLLVSSHLRRRQ
jgi:hypothetical protein